jgi:cell division protease FtsH
MPKNTPPPKKPQNGSGNFKMPNKPSPWLILLAIVFAFTVISSLFSTGQTDITNNDIAYSEFRQNFEDAKYSAVKIRGEEVIGEFGEDIQDTANIIAGSSVSDLGFDNPPEGTKVEVISLERQRFWLSQLSGILPFLIIVGIVIFFMTRVSKNAGGPFSFGQSKAKLFDRRKKRTRFADVAGAYEAKEELMEIVDFLKNPKKYVKMGAKIPRGALLIGPPGTGKTLLARAVAGEANVPFMSISGSEFVEMFVGVGASRVRDLFEKAKKNAPAIIFIDEIDAVGRQRGGGGYGGGGHDEREQTLNQILTEMDGFDNDTSVIVMAATNRPDVLDKALLRPGRFDRRVIIDKPDVQAREEILKVHSKNKPMARNANLKDIAKITIGFSGADLENVMNEAAIFVARENRQKITHEDLSKSVEKVSIGPERKSKIIEPEEKEKVAFHETGHALVAQMLKGAHPVHKVTIVSRGATGGVTWYLPESESQLVTKSQFLDQICSALGGYAAEKYIYNDVSIGASSDLRKATSMARSMATRYGMSDLGPISFAESEDMAGYESFGVKNISDDYAKKIDDFVQKTVNDCLVTTMDVLKSNDKLLHDITEELLKKETLNKQEFIAFFKNVDFPSKKSPGVKIQSGDLKKFDGEEPKPKRRAPRRKKAE